MDLSDDSDFYGDEETIRGLKQRVGDFDLYVWYQQEQENPGRPRRREILITDTFHLHNPYAGVPYAWQVTESVQAFLDRLPPRTTERSENTPWIYICNPYIPRVEKSQAGNQCSMGNEDEAPEEEGSQTQMLIEGGAQRLSLLATFVEGVQKAWPVGSARERDITKERNKATGDILKLAHVAKVRAGKWMLFCPPAEVNEVWEIVAKATANNELGIAAKVAPRSVDEDPRRDRLICVYTADFADKANVGQVLQKLKELRLVEARGRSIYYKPDAFTYLGIASGNPWGLKPTIYSSGELFKG